MHSLQTDKRRDRQTDDNHANSLTVTWVRSAKNQKLIQQICDFWQVQLVARLVACQLYNRSK